MKSIGIIANLSKDTGYKKTKELVNWLENKCINTFTTEEIADRILRKDIGMPPHELYDQADCVIVLGGDGTLLTVARQLAQFNKPILGVNLGRLGYLTEVEVGELYSSLDKLLNDEYFIEERMMLEATIKNSNREVRRYVALNDVCITKGSFSRIINVKIFIGNHFADAFPADGLIISSPTGSTAYSLSAGGPVISPTMHLLLVTPICPHTLNSRPIVVSHDQELKVEIEGKYENIMVTMDGQQGYELNEGEFVLVNKAIVYTSLIRLSKKSFYETLRNKLYERNTDNFGGENET